MSILPDFTMQPIGGRRAEERQKTKDMEEPAAIVDEHISGTVEEAVDMIAP